MARGSGGGCRALTPCWPDLVTEVVLDEMTYKVFGGLDMGKAEHQATALELAVKRLYDKAIANDEAALRALFGQLGEPSTRH